MSVCATFTSGKNSPDGKLLLVFRNGAHRADICTSAALCTQIGIDAVYVTCGYSAYCTFVDAGTASSAIF